MNMTTEQSAELQSLRKQEAAKLKALTKLERSLGAQINRCESAYTKELAAYRRAHDKAVTLALRAKAKELKPLRTQLHRLTAGRVPEASALKSIRHRIAVLEGRLTS